MCENGIGRKDEGWKTDCVKELCVKCCIFKKNIKLDDGWPESEKGDVTAAVNMMITR